MVSEPIEVSLKGTFEEMGQQYIQQLGPKIIEFSKLLEEDLRFENPADDSMFKAKTNAIVDMVIKANAYPNEIMRMYQAMAQSDFAIENNLTLNKLIALDLSVFLTTIHPKVVPPDWIASLRKPESCSFFAITQNGGSVQDDLGVGRNFDWPEYAMHAFSAFPIVLHLDCTEPGYSNMVTLISYPGSISGLTQFNDIGLTWSINSANVAMDVNIPGGMRLDFPYLPGAALIDMFQSVNFKDLYERTKSSPSGYPCTINITGRNITETAAIEKCPIHAQKPGGFKNIARTYNSDNVENETDRITDNGYVHTNLVLAKGWEKYLGKKPNQTTASFAAERQDNLKKLVNDLSSRQASVLKSVTSYLERELEPEGGATKKLPRKEPFRNDVALTHYSTAFCPLKDKLKVRFQQADSAIAQEGKFTPWKTIRTNRP
ncbi:MAG: hypothetical protein U1E78_12150 [Gammaproteobacteria bacterium]